MNRKVLGQAFYKTIPVMAGYLVLGIGFGILIREAGYGVLWAFAMSVFVYAVSMQYVGVGRYGATCAQKQDYDTKFVAEDGAFHEYLEYVTWVPTQNVGAYTLFRKGIDKNFLDRYVEALKQIKEEGIASELSRKFYGYDAYSGEYLDFVD